MGKARRTKIDIILEKDPKRDIEKIALQEGLSSERKI